LKSLAIAFALLAAVLFGTNPTQDEYVSWLKQQATNEAGGDQFGKALMAILGGPILNLGTTREEFFLFSIYHTDLGTGAKINVLGLFHHFIPINQPKPPHVVAVDGEGHFLPEDGYTWINNPPVAGDLRVKWTPGRLSSKNPHVVTAEAEGRWLPEDGYTWLNNPPVAGDFRVKWTPGRLSSKNPHVMAAEVEGRWLPEKGYSWVNNPPIAGDFRVKQDR
jgi:predicted RNA-binding protein associated with RNAse of E/G family